MSTQIPNSAKPPSPILHWFITSLLVGIVLYLIFINENKHLEKETELHKDNARIAEKLLQTSKQRDSLHSLVDSLTVLDQTYIQLIKKKDRELRAVKGKFYKLTNRELEQKMEDEYRAGQTP